MMDRAKMLHIFVESNRRSIEQLANAIEELESGTSTRGTYGALQRAFHTVKHEARHLALERLAAFAESCEWVVERAANRRLGLPIDLLREAMEEIRVANEEVAGGRRHKLDPKLVARAKAAARQALVE